MIHRAPFGSLSDFVAVFELSNCAGISPLFGLSPEQKSIFCLFPENDVELCWKKLNANC